MAKKNTHIHQMINERLGVFMSLLTEKQYQDFLDNISVLTLKKNEIMYKEGEVPEYLHCLLDGKVKVYKDGVGGRTQIIRVIKPVEYFGYRAHFANQNYITAAAAFEASTICIIPLDFIDELRNENIAVANFFIRHLAHELGMSDQRTVNLTQKHIRARLAEALLFLRDCYGLEEDGATLSIYLSREDLANMSNMTTANAIRTLSAFASEQLITIDGRKIKLIDPESIDRICKLG